jgi:hypothetical protein
MNAVSVGFSALAAASILLTIPPFTLLQRRIFVGESTGGRSVALVAATGAVVVALGWATHAVPIPGLLVAPVIALGALFATIATSTMPAASGGRTLVFAAIATAAVFLPFMVLVFGIVFDPFGTQLGVIDLGGGIPALVAGGATALGVSLVGGRPSRRAGPGPGIRSLLWPTLLLWVAWIGWLVGLELAADDMVPIILTSVVVMPAVAGAAGSLVERLRFRRTTASGAVRDWPDRGDYRPRRRGRERGPADAVDLIRVGDLRRIGLDQRGAARRRGDPPQLHLHRPARIGVRAVACRGARGRGRARRRRPAGPAPEVPGSVAPGSVGGPLPGSVVGDTGLEPMTSSV